MSRYVGSVAGYPARRGFTLVELLVVIGIIALLVSILLPSLGAARRAAQTVKCQANLHSIGQALLFYTNENRQLLPPGYMGNPYSGGNPPETNWTAILVAMMDRNTHGGNTNAAGEKANSARSSFRKTFLCPSVPPGATDYDPNDIALTYYTAHPRLMPNFAATDNSPVGNKATTPPTFGVQYRISRVKRSAEVGIVFDGSLYMTNSTYNGGGGGQTTLGYWRPRSGAPVATALDGWTASYNSSRNYFMTSAYGDMNGPVAMYPSIGTPTDLTYYNKDTVGGGNDNNIRFRHGKDNVMNCLFVDGHCGSFNLSAGDKLNSPATAGDLRQANIVLSDLK